MAITQEHVDRLEEAIALGAMEVQYPDKKVVYRSLQQMMAALQWMRRKLDPALYRAQRKVTATRTGLEPPGGSDSYFVRNC